MKNESMLELRVLSGTHAGARVLLPESPQTLGSGSDCDLVLSDEGILAEHARLAFQEDGSVRVDWLGDGPARKAHLLPGQGVDLQGVRIAVSQADAPWADEVELLVPEVDTPAEPMPAPAPARQARAVPLLAWVGAAGVGLLGLVALVVVGVASKGTSAAPGGEAVAAQNAGISPEAVTEAVAPLGMGDRVRVEPDARRGARVRAAFLSDTEVERLVAVVSGLSPRPRLEVLSAEDIVAAIQEMLLNHADAQRGRPTVSLAGAGRVRVEGRARDAASRDQIQAELQHAFPMVRGFDWALSTDEEVAQRLLDELQSLRLGDVQGRWAEGRLSVEARIAPDRLVRWERGLATAIARNPVPFEAQLLAPLAVARASLPFSVRSIVGGAMPYITLGDGRKLVLEGEAEGWRLAGIGATAVIFEHRDGSRITVER